MSRSLSSSRPEPDGRYLDTPPPYTPPRPLTPDPESDSEPPNYPDNQPMRAQHLSFRPRDETLSDPDNLLPFLENKPDEICQKSKICRGEIRKSSRITYRSTGDGKYLGKDSNDDSKLEHKNEQSILNINIKDSDDDLEHKVLSNRPRNPPIISEIEEELKPGNRRKNVRHDYKK